MPPRAGGNHIRVNATVGWYYFTRDVLNRFLDLERGRYAIDLRDRPVLNIARTSLPAVPTVIVLPGGY